MAAEGSFKVACIEFPHLDGAILGAGGELGVLGMEGESSDDSLVTAHLILGWCLDDIQIFIIGVGRAWLPGSLG